MKVFDCEYVGYTILERSLNELSYSKRLEFVTKKCLELASSRTKKARIEQETEKISILLYDTLRSGSNVIHQLVEGRVENFDNFLKWKQIKILKTTDEIIHYKRYKDRNAIAQFYLFPATQRKISCGFRRQKYKLEIGMYSLPQIVQVCKLWRR